VANTISHSFAALTREILCLPLEHKIHIFSTPCNILYLRVFASSDDWFVLFFVPAVIGQSNYFGFGFTTLIYKPLYGQYPLKQKCCDSI